MLATTRKTCSLARSMFFVVVKLLEQSLWGEGDVTLYRFLQNLLARDSGEAPPRKLVEFRTRGHAQEVEPKPHLFSSEDYQRFSTQKNYGIYI